MRTVAILSTLIAVSLAITSCKPENSGNNNVTSTATAAAASKSMVSDLPDKPHEALRNCSQLPTTDFEVDVVFTGLMMFVPDDLDTSKPLKADPTGHQHTTWTVLIPDARVDPGTHLPPDDPQPFMVHTPFVGADPQYLCTDSTADLKDTWCPTFTYQELNGTEIQWDSAFTSGVTSPPTYKITFDGDGICPKPNGSDLESLHWLPSMGEIGFAGMTLNPNFVGPNPAAGDVAGRTSLKGGTLKACVLSKQKMNFKVRVSDSPSNARQVIAEEVHYQLKGRGRTFTLTLAPRGGGQNKTLVLAPDANHRVELRIGNVPKTFIPPTTVLGTPEKFDPHFGVYHRFITGGGAMPIIPHEELPFCNSPLCTSVVSRPCVRPTISPGASADGRSQQANPSPEGANCGGGRP